MRLEPKLKFLNGQTQKTLIDAPKHDMLQTERDAYKPLPYLLSDL
jgi:hypothetical protein